MKKLAALALSSFLLFAGCNSLPKIPSLEEMSSFQNNAIELSKAVKTFRVFPNDFSFSIGLDFNDDNNLDYESLFEAPANPQTQNLYPVDFVGYFKETHDPTDWQNDEFHVLSPDSKLIQIIEQAMQFDTIPVKETSLDETTKALKDFKNLKIYPQGFGIQYDFNHDGKIDYESFFDVAQNPSNPNHYETRFAGYRKIGNPSEIKVLVPDSDLMQAIEADKDN